MRALLLGSQSFLDNDSKVGIQYIAEGLAKNGWQVDYITNASSLLDSVSRSRRSRFRRIWMEGQKNGFEISGNLKEYGFKSLFPTRKEVLRAKWQIRLYPSFVPETISNTVYDVCIHDSSNTFLFLPKIRARHFIYRLNDLPSGFSFAIHRNVIKMFDSMVASGLYDEIWAVSEPLAEYARELNGKNHVCVIPNGVEVHHAPVFDGIGPRRPRSAVFVGNIFPWIDLKLVCEAARLLPNWVMDFYGPLRTQWAVESANIRYNGVLERDRIGQTLRQYQVGLIPFRDVADRMHTVEQPLKFYEYISAGLGVAATEVGGLKKGMGEWASYGKTPEEFSKAILSASKAASLRSNTELKNFLEEHSWNSVVGAMLKRLEAVLENRKPGGYSRMDIVI